ncbi:MAG: hypothetical protein QOD71_1786 [Thermoleophilaceae bacterium]|jgi:uncharacterized membrane protein|nr:hypothetical protein [Thermoleophilaceae bacterium]
MREAASNAGRKLIAVAILLLAAYLLFKVVIGTLMAVFWIIVAVVALVAVVWALGVLR